jgi:hypothetical protein
LNSYQFILCHRKQACGTLFVTKGWRKEYRKTPFELFMKKESREERADGETYGQTHECKTVGGEFEKIDAERLHVRQEG